MGKSRPFEKCMIAAETLATLEMPLRERLEYAYMPAMVSLDAPGIREQMPAEARDALRELAARISRVLGGPEGSVRATLTAATDEEVHEIAGLAWKVISKVLWES
jgi:hypothetical protein